MTRPPPLGSECPTCHRVGLIVQQFGKNVCQYCGQLRDPDPAVCLDCGLAYAHFPLDVILPRPQWLTIHPADHGLLCAGCIATRASKVPGATCLHAIIEIAPRSDREDLRQLAQTFRVLVPEPLLSDLLGYLDPLTPFVKALQALDAKPTTLMTGYVEEDDA